jgi:RNA polymerase sigma factor (sigma-70 family)
MYDRIIRSIIYRRQRAASYLGLGLDDLHAVANLAVVEAEQTWRPDGGAQISSWVYRKVRTRVQEALAAAGRELAHDVEYSGADDDMEAQILVREALEYLQARISPDDWRLLWFRHVEGYGGQELADMWGLTYGGLRVKLHVAKNRALTILDAHG